MLEQLLKFLFSHKRLVLSGATGIGKSNLARQLASYLSVRIGLEQDGVVDIKIPDDTNDKGIVKVENQLATLLRSSDKAVVLIDNIPRHRIAFVSSVFSSVELNYDDGPFVICTVNRACQLPEMQVHHNFKMFLLTNRMDGVKGFMGRFLRRRMIESEFRLSQQTPPELVRVMQFLPVVLQAVNSFIEKANSLDVTVGPRIFLQCPLGVDESRAWFVRLWNQNILPYMVKVAREGEIEFIKCKAMFQEKQTFKTYLYFTISQISITSIHPFMSSNYCGCYARNELDFRNNTPTN
uniref:AAA domain-containing protein n=1 Tax=Heterorhabditis bacteriophora TaxID=37862 RepID=A0A1I7XTM6_HETBA